MVKANQIHVLWQIPQYILLTAAEVMFSIPSMELAYTQVSTEKTSISFVRIHFFGVLTAKVLVKKNQTTLLHSILLNIDY